GLGAVGTAMAWLPGIAQTPPADRLDRLYELNADALTCRGGAASIDFALALIEAIYGTSLQAEIMRVLCVQHVRRGSNAPGAGDASAGDRFGVLQPKLAEALQLMEANIEEPLATDDIANLVGISRRQ